MSKLTDFQRGICYGEIAAEEAMIEMLRSRICFDYAKDKVCMHSVCRGNGDLITILLGSLAETRLKLAKDEQE